MAIVAAEQISSRLIQYLFRRARLLGQWLVEYRKP